MIRGYLKFIFSRSFPAFILAGSTLLAIPAAGDSSSPRLAAYYDSFLAICGNMVFEWHDDGTPQQRAFGAKQVGIGKNNRYALTDERRLLAWRDNPEELTTLMNDVSSFYAGRSGLFAVRSNNSLWQIETEGLLGFGEAISRKASQLASDILTAAVGDSANYYVTREGVLFVQGLAHRGQYGDGKLSATDHYIQTFQNVAQVVAHTGHALVLKRDGSVWGTGGNIYGPLGSHGYGDKAVEWGLILNGAIAIATGSSHSLAIKQDHSLWIWGRNEGLDPKQVMSDVDAVAAGNNGTIALSKGALWQWDTGAMPEMIMECL